MNQNWEVLYRHRHVSVENAVSLIKKDQKVFLAPFCNEPQTLVRELVRQKERVQHITIFNMVIGSPCLYAQEECHPFFDIKTFLSSSVLKDAFLHSVCDYIPQNLSEIPQWIEQEQIDVALIQVTPPNEEGNCNLGISVDVIQSVINRADFVIAEVNPNLPYTNGDTLVHVSKIDQFVPSSSPVLTLPRGTPSEIEMEIGRYVAMLIPDGATIQIGIGKIAEGILQSLKEKKGLGIHSGSITDGIMDLIKAGVITNKYKEIYQYHTVCTTLTGTKQLYQFAHQHKNIKLYPANYTHNPTILAKLSNFHSVNSALEVDIFGQINAEQLGNFPIAGVGGQMDFIKGARFSQGGKAIIALPSTAQRGSHSRIKFSIPHVTSIKSDIDYIVTEYGIASLFGKSLKERATALIAIAHPSFREILKKDFEKWSGDKFLNR